MPFFKRLFYPLVVLLVILVGVGLFFQMEGEKPVIALDLPYKALGENQPLPLTITDTRSGVGRVTITLAQGDQKSVLLDEKFPGTRLWGGGEKNVILQPETAPTDLGFKEGDAIVTVTARDYSWRGFFRGNKTRLELPVTIDVKAPGITVLTRMHNVNQGGAGFAIYRLSEPCPVSGVQVGDHFYPGYAGYFKDPDIHLALFALAYDQKPDTPIFIQGTDAAGNVSQSRIPKYLKPKNFRQDTIRLSDAFLERKMPEFKLSVQDAANPLLAKFLKINGEMRRANAETIREITQTSDARFHWKGAFVRMPNAQRMAGFADHRDYQYQGKTVDQQVHLGIDLAGVGLDKVLAANNGKVVFADMLGIYGQTVIVDHGFGLFSLYSHLSRIDAMVGTLVQKRALLGQTGATGMAGGDHLHFSMLVNGVFVNPIEWWDAAWIKNNIIRKLDDVKALGK